MPTQRQPENQNPRHRTTKRTNSCRAQTLGSYCSDQLGINFRRQHAVGNYIPDFVCIEKELIIELDWSQHLEQEEYDQERTKYLESLGYKVIRFWNNDVINNIDSVILAILHAMEDENK